MFAACRKLLHISGSATSTSSESQDHEPEPEEIADAFVVLGLLKKDYARPLSTGTLDGLATRQLAYTVACITDTMMSSDILEIGGDMEPWICNQMCYMKHPGARLRACCYCETLLWHVGMTCDRFRLGREGFPPLICMTAQEGLLQDRLLSAKKKRDRAEETAASFEACTDCNFPFCFCLCRNILNCR